VKEKLTNIRYARHDGKRWKDIVIFPSHIVKTNEFFGGAKVA
jgi:hypothetical protein